MQAHQGRAVENWERSYRRRPDSDPKRSVVSRISSSTRPPLAVHVLEEHLRIARARHRLRRHRSLDLRHLLRTEGHSQSSERLGELIAAACPDQRHDHGPLRGCAPSDPGDGDLCDGDIELNRDRPQLFHQGEILVEVAGGKARLTRAEVALVSVFAPVSADEPA